MADQAEVHRVLVDARNVLDREGWVGKAASGGPYCSMQAVSQADGSLGIHASLASEAWYGAVRVLDAAVGCAIEDWNDIPGRTKEEVLAAFDKAILATAPEPPDPFAVQPVGQDTREEALFIVRDWQRVFDADAEDSE